MWNLPCFLEEGMQQPQAYGSQPRLNLEFWGKSEYNFKYLRNEIPAQVQRSVF